MEIFEVKVLVVKERDSGRKGVVEDSICCQRCVGGNWRNREGNEIWNSVTLLPRVVSNHLFRYLLVYLRSLDSFYY